MFVIKAELLKKLFMDLLLHKGRKIMQAGFLDSHVLWGSIFYILWELKIYIIQSDHMVSIIY